MAISRHQNRAARAVSDNFDYLNSSYKPNKESLASMLKKLMSVSSLEKKV